MLPPDLMSVRSDKSAPLYGHEDGRRESRILPNLWPAILVSISTVGAVLLDAYLFVTIQALEG